MRTSRMIGITTAALVAVGGYVHLCLYRSGYRTIPKIGVAFLLQVVASAVVSLALLLGPRVVARTVRVRESVAVTLLELGAGALAAGTLVAFALTRTRMGLFDFREQGLQPAPQALIALLAESAVVVLATAWLVTRAARHQRAHGIKVSAM